MSSTLPVPAAARPAPIPGLLDRYNLRERFGVFTYRDYRLLFAGQAVSAIGSWMQLVAQGWLVYALTGSPFYLGLVALARAIPTVVFSLIGGAVADRADRRLVIAAANGVAGLLAGVLGLLVWFNAVSIWHIIAISFFSALAFSFEVPCRQALISDIVDEKDVVSAVGLNSLAFNIAAVIGPALAGILIMRIDEGAIFLLNGASYAAVVASILMTRPGQCCGSSDRSVLSDTYAGLKYVWRTPELLALIGLMVITSLLARPYTQLLPVFASDVLQIGAAGLAALNAAAGGGAIVAGIVVAVFGTFPRRGLVIALSGVVFGVALSVFAFSTSMFVSMAAAGVLGLCGTYSSIGANTMLQTYSEERLRGRVMGLHGLTMMGLVPLGAMLEGSLGSAINVPTVLCAAGALTAVATLFIAVRAARLRELE